MKISFCILFYFIFINILFANENNYYLILKNNKVNVRYGPGFDYPIKFIYKKINLPIKLIDKKENFRKIIDLKNNSGWIHTSQLKKTNSIIILENKFLFKRPSILSKPLLKLKKGRLLVVKKCQNKWCNIKTDKYSGWIKNNNIWGFAN
jgi:SH3-like domain-containing protein